MSRSANRRYIGLFVVFSVVGFFLRPVWADDASAKLYQSKCVACHGADGSGNTTVGKMLAIKDLHDPEIQKLTDVELANIIAKGKNKMPASEKSLKPAEIQGLVAYVRELGKKS